ncbi:hypothetical protein ACIRS1_35130 [Kitasatospora sp. NPDC101176]|uniref:hypothetical protein n=1 Tax=Kitasatospora sp. NPDC101176 TaxID=3364099 RepID=UPI00382BEA15
MRRQRFGPPGGTQAQILVHPAGVDDLAGVHPVARVEQRSTSFRPRRCRPSPVYARTKRQELVITEEWARRLDGTGVHVHAMHPGWADTEGVRQWLPVFRALTRPVIRTPEQGADTVVWLGAAPEAVQCTGLFWHDRRPRPITHALGAAADSPATRRELWTHLTALTGIDA